MRRPGRRAAGAAGQRAGRAADEATTLAEADAVEQQATAGSAAAADAGTAQGSAAGTASGTAPGTATEDEPARGPRGREARQAPVIAIRPMASPARFRFRHKGLIAAFFTVVVLPVLVSAWYLETRAADQYASTLGFTVRSEELQSATDLLGGVGAALGGSGGKDSDILYEFIRSQEMVAAVEAQLDLSTIYALHTDTDPVFGFDRAGTIEDLTDYWQRMVRVSYDSASGLMELNVRAFTPEDARAIAEAILAESTAMINSLSAIAREDAMAYASEDLDLALERLKTAREAITAFRLANQIVDVNADIQGQMGLLNTLQAQLAEALIDYDLLLDSAREGDPRLDQARSRIDVIQARIDEERNKFGDGEGSANYATTVAEFERLTVEREFAETTYLAALQALDAARAEANRQSRYLATYIRPTLAQAPEYPQRETIIGLVALFAFLIWTIGSLIFYALRDRQ